MLTLISLEAQRLTESMFTMIVGLRERERGRERDGERWGANARAMCDSEKKSVERR